MPNDNDNDKESIGENKMRYKEKVNVLKEGNCQTKQMIGHMTLTNNDDWWTAK